MKVNFSKAVNIDYSLDICVMCDDDYEKTILSINAACSMHRNVTLHVAGKGEILDFLSVGKWFFKEVYFYNLEDNRPSSLKKLIEKTSSEYVMIMIGGELYQGAINVISASHADQPEACVSLSILPRDRDSSHRFTYTCTGIATLDVPIIPRKILKIDDGYDSIHGAIQNLTLQLFFDNYSFVYLHTSHYLHYPKTKVIDLYPSKKDAHKLISKWCHQFPEKKYYCDEQGYLDCVARGYEKMSRSRAAICGLARGIAGHWKATGGARFEHLASLFKDHVFIVYENDSDDETVEYLSEWQKRDPERRIFHTEKLGRERLGGRGSTRVERMAEYRNKCLDIVNDQFSDYHYYIPIDMDLTGGFSYDGIANTIGSELDWSGVGSNGKNSRRSNKVYWDTFAHRDLGHGIGTYGGAVREYHRKYTPLMPGDPMVPVNSCFGGLGIYKMADISGCVYTGEASEHVPFHRDIRKNGNIFLNPAQVVLYNYLDWCDDQNNNLNYNLHDFYSIIGI